MTKTLNLNSKNFLKYSLLISFVFISLFVLFTNEALAQWNFNEINPSFTIDSGNNVIGTYTCPPSLDTQGGVSGWIIRANWWPINVVTPNINSGPYYQSRLGSQTRCPGGTTFSVNYGQLGAGTYVAYVSFEAGIHIYTAFADVNIKAATTVCVGGVLVAGPGPCEASGPSRSPPVVNLTFDPPLIPYGTNSAGIESGILPSSATQLTVSWTTSYTNSDYACSAIGSGWNGLSESAPIPYKLIGFQGSEVIPASVFTGTPKYFTINCNPLGPYESGSISRVVYPPGTGAPPATTCTSSANACGQTNTGTIVNGSCNATTPANPTGFGSACTSSQNSCGQTSPGTIGCNGSCSATTPPNSSCPAPVLTFSVTPTTIDSGQSSNLTWAATNATTCTASGAWSGAKSTSGNESTGALNASRNYTLTCTGSGGTIDPQSITVSVNAPAPPPPVPTVPAPVLTFSVTPTTIDSGQSSNLTWAATNATTCTASGAWSGAKSTSGNESTGALNANRNYTLTCTGSGGTTDPQSITVSVNAPAPPPSPVSPDISLSADDTSVSNGSGTTIRWNATNANSGNSCTASGAWSGARAASGSSATGNLTSNQTYSLICNGANGGVSPLSSVTVNVGAAIIACTSSANSCGATNPGTIVGGVCNATTPANPSGYGTACASSANACGQTISGTRQCNGSCNATTPPNPSGYGTACASSANSCGQTSSSGTIQCDGSCSSVTPPNSSCPATVVACTSSANDCSQTNPGTIVGGVCNATTPANPSGYGNACASSANACGQTSPGTILCNGSCSANTPPNSSCPAPAPTACTSAENSCGATSNGTIVGGVCNASIPPNPTGYGNACASSANSCGQTGPGTILCNGSCSAVTPPNSSCPVSTTACASPANSCGKTTAGTLSGEVCSVNSAPSLPTGFGTACQSDANACGQRITGTMGCNAQCNASIPANPSGYGAVCNSAANSCGERNSGTTLCNGSCSAIAPSNSSCSSSLNTVEQAQTPAPTLTFNVSEPQIGSSSVNLRWTAVNASSCEASGDWSGTKDISGTHSTGNLTSSKRYSLVCSGQGGSVSRSVNVNVVGRGSSPQTTSTPATRAPATQAPAGGNNLSPTMLFVADRGERAGEVRFSWSSTNASSCIASGGWSGSKGTSGNATLSINSDTRFTLACSGSGGEALRTLQVERQALAIPTTSSPSRTPTTPTRPSKPTAGTSPRFIPKAPTPVPLTSTVVRENSEGDIVAISSGKTSLVSPPVISLVASPIVPFNNPANIEWSVANATKCLASGNWQGEKQVNGEETTTPLQEDVVYTLHCEGNGGEASRTIEIVVVKEEPTVTRILDNLFGGLTSRISNFFSPSEEETVEIPVSDTNIKAESKTGGESPTAPKTTAIPSFPDSVTPNAISKNAPPQVILYVTPIVKAGATANLEWKATNVSTCVASGDWNGGKPIQGSELTADLFEDTTYTINCFGDNGTTTATVGAAVYQEDESFLGRIQKNVAEAFNRIIGIFSGGSQR